MLRCSLNIPNSCRCIQCIDDRTNCAQLIIWNYVIIDYPLNVCLVCLYLHETVPSHVVRYERTMNVFIPVPIQTLTRQNNYSHIRRIPTKMSKSFSSNSKLLLFFCREYLTLLVSISSLRSRSKQSLKHKVFYCEL